VDTDLLFSTLANPVRRRLLEILADGPRTAGGLAGEFDLSRPAVSEHLQVLQRASLVVGTQSGRERHYQLNARPLAEVEQWLRPFERYWRAQLSNLTQLLEETEE